MSSMRTILSLFLMCIFSPSIAQFFWTESFGSGCNSGQQVTSYSGPNGPWSVVNTGFNETAANAWFVSATENGNTVGTCGSGCGSNRTLHLGALNSPLGSDLGAAYYEGFAGLCQILSCASTDKRVESPTINCSGRSNIILEFNYIEGGNDIDNATLWYFDGALWSQLADMDKTISPSCAPQGIWSPFSIELPASANNNPNVRIGFRWVNNDDGVASDPSFAVDVIRLFEDLPVVDDVPPSILCSGISFVELDENCSFQVPDYSGEVVFSDNIDNDLTYTQNPPAGSVVFSAVSVECTVTDDAGNSASCFNDIVLFDPIGPEITCPPDQQATIIPGGFVTNVIVPLPVVNENCAAWTLINSYNGQANASDGYPLGDTEVQFEVTDVYGNVGQCNMVITVVEGISCCPVDLNCDGIVSIADYLIFVANFGCENGCPGDIDDDGVAGVADLLLLNSAFGSFCP
jgi:hypothetical protein